MVYLYLGVDYGSLFNILLDIVNICSFVGESMHDDGTMVFAYYKDGATDPTFLYFAHGLKEVKCWKHALALLEPCFNLSYETTILFQNCVLPDIELLCSYSFVLSRMTIELLSRIVEEKKKLGVFHFISDMVPDVLRILHASEV